ncbi:MAG: hypothetical protein AB1813_05920 [Verrucomicrobiota bacterium]
MLCLLLWLAFFPAKARAELQFDVFFGYDGIIHEANWFPVVCEIFNDGPSFNATIELSAGMGSDQLRRVPVELPTNTRKRIVVPMFGGSMRFGQWEGRLVDERGRMVAERRNIQLIPMPWESLLLGAVPRNFGGSPLLPELRANRDEIKPRVAKLQLDQLPDNPIALEGLDALYLNSEKAVSLKVPQVAALLSWLHGGGHLILAVEQITDVNATPWLAQLLPMELTSVANRPVDEEIVSWMQTESRPGSTRISRVVQSTQPRSSSRRTQIATVPNPYANLPRDPNFVSAQLPVATGTLRDGWSVCGPEQAPLIAECYRGRGRLTLLTFSPEREPFRSWKQRGHFWARLIDMPHDWFSNPDFNQYGGWSIDGVLGALLDSRQVRKLPVEWLLLLLVVYLIVIGPFDQYWLKKINRQMLTWITFPTYVVLFSLLIYFIGYKLRAGETEWNELNIVDVIPRGNRVEWRGRTYASVYSSANARYPLSSELPFATLRSEFIDMFGGGREGSRASVVQTGNNFRAEINVPVWTSLLFVGDWLQPGMETVKVTLDATPSSWNLTVQNLLATPLKEARIVIEGWVFELEELPPQQIKTFQLDRNKGMALKNFIERHGSDFSNKVEQRRQVLGSDVQGRLEDSALVGTVASFASLLSPYQERQRGFVSPAGFDLTHLAYRGDTILFALAENESLVKSMRQFNPPRQQKHTLLRITLPAPTPSGGR